MEKLEKVNRALRHLYQLVTIVGTFDKKERDLFCSYIEYRDKESECKETIKNFKRMWFTLNNIKEFRKKKKLSQTNIAQFMDIKQNTFSQWETGERTPNVIQAIKLAEILETTVESLYK